MDLSQCTRLDGLYINVKILIVTDNKCKQNQADYIINTVTDDNKCKNTVLYTKI